MQLNIENDEAYRMAKELSQLTGENVTQVIIKAIREQLELEHRRIKAHRQGVGNSLRALSEEYQALPKKDPRDSDEILYDELGLPRSQRLQ
jgi:antitoxin VapB